MRRRQLNKKRIGRFRSVPFGFVSFRSKAVARFKIGLRFSHFPTQLPSSLSSYVSYSYFSSFLSLQSLLYNPLTQSQLSRLYIPNHSSIQGFLFIEMSNSENRERNSMEKITAPFPVHSQVRKIKEESETIIDWRPGQPEIRPPTAAFRQISRSPLGISGRPISVGESQKEIIAGRDTLGLVSLLFF